MGYGLGTTAQARRADIFAAEAAAGLSAQQEAAKRAAVQRAAQMTRAVGGVPAALARRVLEVTNSAFTEDGLSLRDSIAEGVKDLNESMGREIDVQSTVQGQLRLLRNPPSSSGAWALGPLIAELLVASGMPIPTFESPLIPGTMPAPPAPVPGQQAATASGPSPVVYAVAGLLGLGAIYAFTRGRR